MIWMESNMFFTVIKQKLIFLFFNLVNLVFKDYPVVLNIVFLRAFFLLFLFIFSEKFVQI